jgi:hypothetical protein
MSMNGCVIVKVSRRAVTFWYGTEGQRYSPLLMKGIQEVPLYFYVDNNQFDFGARARDRFYSNDPNAFGDYFELVRDPSRHFVLHNSAKRVKQLLYYGIEQYLSHFLNTVLYKSDAIESYRGAFPLKFIFEPDLGEPERQLVAGLFREAGYRTVSVPDYNGLLLEHLRESGFLRRDQAALLLTGLDDTLYLELYAAGSAVAVSGIAIAGQGADPRIRILAGMIVEYIGEQNPYLDLDRGREVSALLPYCAGLLTDGRLILTGEAELSGGDKYWFRVNLKNVEDSLQYYAGDLVVNTSVHELLQKFNIRPEELLVLLCSGQIRTPYFTERVLKQFPQVKSITPVHTDEVMQLIASQVSQTATTRPEINAPGLPPKGTVPAIKPPLPAAKPAVKPALPPPLPAARPAAAEPRKPVLPPPLPPTKKKS